MKYYQVRIIKELHQLFYVAAEGQDQAEEIAMERSQLEDEADAVAYEYETITEEAEKDWNDEWLMENEDGDFEYVEVK